MPVVKNRVQERTSNAQARAGTRVVGKNAPQARNPICGFKNINSKRRVWPRLQANTALYSGWLSSRGGSFVLVWGR